MSMSAIQEMHQSMLKSITLFMPKLRWLLACTLLSGALYGCATTPGREQALGYFVSAAYSPDRKLLAASTSEGEVALFDARPLWFRRLLTSAADKTTISRSYDKMIDVMYRPRPLTFSRDGALLAASGVSGNVVVWDVRSSSEKFRIPVSDNIADMVFLRDGQTLVTVGPDVVLRSVRGSAHSVDVALPVGSQATAVTLSPDGQVLVVGLANGEIAMFDVVSRTLLRIVKAHQAPVSGVAFQPDGMALASTAGGYDLRLWKQTAEGGFEKSELPAAATTSAAKTMEHAQGAGALLWLLGSLRGFQMVGAPTLGVPPVIAGAESQFAKAADITPWHCGSRVAFSGDGRYLVSTANLLMCSDCIGTLAPAFLLFVTDIQSGTTTSVRDLGCEVAIAPDGKTFATAGSGAPQIRDIVTGQRLTETPGRN